MGFIVQMGGCCRSIAYKEGLDNLECCNCGMVRVRARVMIIAWYHGERSGNRVAARGGMRGVRISPRLL